MYARGLLIGLTRGTRRAHIVRAALEAMAYQTCDVINSMVAAASVPVSVVRVDGGAAVNDLAMQLQSDMLQVPVQRPQVVETTALGAAYLAGLAVGYWESQDQIAANWRLDRTYTPQMSVQHRDHLYRGWQEAVRRSRAWATEAST
jgi:glycerol kinase